MTYETPRMRLVTLSEAVEPCDDEEVSALTPRSRAPKVAAPEPVRPIARDLDAALDRLEALRRD